MRVAIATAAIALSAGCVTPASVFPCATSTDCPGGMCEPAGWCSFPAVDCPSGHRFGDASGDGLANQCTTDLCGNGVLDAQEQCDDDADATDACVRCRVAVCGDGHVRDGVEDCDDGNTVDSDGCTASCMTCDGTVGPNGHCYTYYSPSPVLTWAAAADDCQARGGYLATMSSAEENQLVASLLPPSTDAWIGLDDQDGSYGWQDDEPYGGYTSWDAGEPNGGTDEDCAELRTDGSWNDIACDGTRTYVCERTPPTIDPMTQHAYRHFGGVARRRYSDAALDCTARKGHTVTITSASEKGVVDGITAATAVWIGLNDIASEGTYVWDTGEPFTFTSWGVGEPGVDDCMMLATDDAWHDNPCTRLNGYLCEIEP